MNKIWIPNFSVNYSIILTISVYVLILIPFQVKNELNFWKERNN